MNMLGEQIKELRLMGDGQAAKGEFAVATLLREAADTIESMQDSLNEVAGRWAEAQIKSEDYSLENMLLKIDNDTRWYELFGTPEEAARTLLYVLACKDSRPWVACEECSILGGCAASSDGHDALLEWLRGDAE